MHSEQHLQALKNGVEGPPSFRRCRHRWHSCDAHLVDRTRLQFGEMHSEQHLQALKNGVEGPPSFRRRRHRWSNRRSIALATLHLHLCTGWTSSKQEPDEDPDSASPIFDAFLETQGANGIHTMTNFSPSEFNVLWADVRIYVTKHWNVGSGRKSEVSARDLLLMLLTSLKHCGS
ncbi:hypothetical protein H257_09108 [Aphanomyces astaci]|uniref:Uncharacterized protein n=1 Tax=Aphanomyces astaci TaxID=112090 RepID=W4GD67_APHAT|nr:hypothetical protein H257_09108 [Aphanomyces astaci]ETV77221.1 hypothetical protein H257_09108 [Aphanomyces astaci]|eukprot:XP_009833527.1 hypothetical protein H257_09108 [Aphanomyces astaci]